MMIFIDWVAFQQNLNIAKYIHVYAHYHFYNYASCCCCSFHLGAILHIFIINAPPNVECRKLPILISIDHLIVLRTYQEQPEWPQSRRPPPAGRGCRADPPSSGHISSGRDPAWSRNPRYASSQQRTTLLSCGGKKCLINVMNVFLLKKVKL